MQGGEQFGELAAARGQQGFFLFFGAVKLGDLTLEIVHFGFQALDVLGQRNLLAVDAGQLDAQRVGLLLQGLGFFLALIDGPFHVLKPFADPGGRFFGGQRRPAHQQR